MIPHNGSLIMTKALAETLIILAIILWNENPFGVFSKSDSSLKQLPVYLIRQPPNGSGNDEF